MIEKDETKQDNYIFSSDHDAELERLKRLNELYNSHTVPFLLDNIGSLMTVLEIGCGTGEVSRQILKHRGDVQYYGIEPTAEAVCTCQKLADSENLKYFIGDLTKIHEHQEISKNRYDVIFLRWVLAYIPESEMRPAIKNLFSLLKKGGALILEECDVYACHTLNSRSMQPVKIQAFEDWMLLTKNVDEKLSANFRLGEKIRAITEEVLKTS